MARLLVDSPDGAKLVPFALGKLRALRAAGFSQIVQRYQVQGFDVRVTINGADEIVEVRGENWDYLVLPASIEHPEGVDTKDGKPVPPVASLTLTGNDKGLRRKEHSKLLAGPHDWLSADAKLSLSYDHGHGFRYALNGGYEPFAGARVIYRNGAEIATDHGVKGAAVFRATTADGVAVQRVIYATYEFAEGLATGLRLFYLGGKRDDGTLENVQFAAWSAPAGTVIAQPTFFDGVGGKLVTVLETVTVTGVPPDELYTFGRPRYVVRAAIALGDDGTLAATFSTAALDEAPEQSLETANQVRKNPSDPFWVWGSMQSDKSESTQYSTGQYPGVVTFFNTTDTAASGYSRTVTTSRTVRFVGLDLGADGTELLVERYTDTSARTFSEESEALSSSGTLKHYTDLNNPYLVLYSGARAYSSARVSGGDSYVRVTYAINREPLFSVDTSHAQAGMSQTSNWSDVQADVPAPGANPPAPTVSTQVYDNAGRNMLSLRDIDARNQAIAVVVGAYVTPFNGSVLRPLKLDLLAKCHGQTASKTVFDGVVYEAPGGASADQWIRRAIASRRPSEFVICFSPEDPTDPTFSAHLASTGAVDREPLFALRRKEKAITPAPDKFSLDTEPGFRFDPVHVF